MKKVLLIMMCIVATVIWGGNVYGQTEFGNGSTYAINGSDLTIVVNKAGDLALFPNQSLGNTKNIIIKTATDVVLNEEDLNSLVSKLTYGNTDYYYDMTQAAIPNGTKLSEYFLAWGNKYQTSYIFPYDYQEASSSFNFKYYVIYTDGNKSKLVVNDQGVSKSLDLSYLKSSSEIILLGGTKEDIDYSKFSALKKLDLTGLTLSSKTSTVTVPEDIEEIKVLEGFDVTRIEPEDARKKVKVSTPKADPYKVEGCYITINLDEDASLESAYAPALASMRTSSLLADANPCEIVINGNITPADLAYLKNINTEFLDLSNATFVDDAGEASDEFVNSENFTNPYVKYLVFPLGKEKLVTEGNVKGFTALCSAGTYTEIEPASEDGKVKSKYSLTAYVNKAGYLHDLTGGMVGIGSSITKNTQQASDDSYPVVSLTFNPNLANVKNIKLSGIVNAVDLGSGFIYVDKRGHLAVEEYVSNDGLPMNQMASKETEAIQKKEGALNQANFNFVDYSGIKFDILENESDKVAAQNDLSFGLLGGYANVTDFKLPTDKSIYRIPRNAFKFGSKKLTSIYIPSNFTELGSSCFADNFPLTLVYTDNGKTGDDFKYVVGGKEVDEITDENYSITLPPFLKKVATGAFALDEQFTDVYVLSKEAPICEVNSFSSGTLYGWGGFTNTNPITQASYVKRGQRTFATLHWPSGIPEKEVKRFTDINRKYSIQDGLQNTDGDGNTLCWPNQLEYNKAFLQATHGYLWNAWSTDNSINNTPTANKEAADGAFGDGDPKNIFYSETVEGYDTEEYDADYRGWHQFVLGNSVNYDSDKPQFDFGRYKANDWYSICLPFDLDEEEVLKIFGVPQGNDIVDAYSEQVADKDIMPNLCTLYKVVRNDQLNRITLWFTPNLAEARMDWSREEAKMVEPETRNGKKIIIKAGFPYLIKPYLPADVIEDVKRHAKRLMGYDPSNNSENARDFDATYKQKLPYRDWFIQAVDQNGDKLQGTYMDGDTEKTVDYMYHFLGTYSTVDLIPMYSYFIANNGKNNIWYYNKWTPEQYSSAWNANTCLVGPMANLTLKQGTELSNFSSVSFDFAAHSDDFPGMETRAKLYMNFDDGQTTEIIGVTDDGKVQTPQNCVVYNLNGQIVSGNGSLENLPKGVYIMNGKKYIVK